LDHIVAIWTLIRTLKQLQNVKLYAHIYTVFNNQEDVHLKHDIISRFGFQPDIGIKIDLVPINDFDNSAHDPKPGKGPIINASKGSKVSHPFLVSFLKMTAHEKKIPQQILQLPEMNAELINKHLHPTGYFLAWVAIPSECFDHKKIRVQNTDLVS